MSNVLDKLRQIDPGDSTEIDDVDEIYDLVDTLFEGRNSLADNEVDVLFSLFEKFPADYYSHVLWNIIHGLEHFGRYQDTLVTSLRRSPSCVGVMMAHRLLNGGFTNYDGIQYFDLLKEIATRDDCAAAVRERALKSITAYTEANAEPQR